MTRIGASKRTWLPALRRYLAVIAGGNLAWETAQLSLYTIWREAPPRTIAAAVLHCTAGDVMIGTLTLIAAFVLAGHDAWPRERFGAVMVTVILLGLGYTVWSEYLNTVMHRSWAYSAWMPVLPWLGTGLAPLAQWIVVPSLALIIARGRSDHAG